MASNSNNVSLTGKTIIITGANAGIGYETALELAKRDAHLILACRDQKRGQEALDKIKNESNNTKIELELLDLSSLKSIKEFSERIQKKLNRLDVLINNAGLLGPPKRQLTQDGFEATFGVNHLGHFYLTNQLLDLLKKSAPSRIVNLSSRAHYSGKINFDDLQSEKSYQEWQVYCNSKLCNVLFTLELARRLKDTGVAAVSLHPGVIKTELFRNNSSQSSFANSFINFFVKNFGKTPKQGARCSIYCATSDDIPAKSGLYFDDTRIKKASRDGQNLELAEKLWETSAKLIENAHI